MRMRNEISEQLQPGLPRPRKQENGECKCDVGTQEPRDTSSLRAWAGLPSLVLPPSGPPRLYVPVGPENGCS